MMYLQRCAACLLNYTAMDRVAQGSLVVLCLAAARTASASLDPRAQRIDFAGRIRYAWPTWRKSDSYTM